MALVAVFVAPLLMMSNLVMLKFSGGFKGNSDTTSKEASTILSDCITNFKTVQSFGNQDVLIKTIDQIL